MADGGAVGYAGGIVTHGFDLVRRGVAWLLDDDAGRLRQNGPRPQDRPPEALEPGPLAGPDAVPENAHRVNGEPAAVAAAAAAAAAAGVADATAQAAERARMATRSRYAFVLFMTLSFWAGFGAGMCWGAATASVSSGDSGPAPPVADPPKFRVTFNVEGHTAEDIKFKLNMIADPVKPPPSPEWPVWGVLRSVSKQAAITARSVSERATLAPGLAFSFLREMVTSLGDDTGSTGGGGSSGGGGSGGSGGGGEWPKWNFLLRSVSEQAAVTARQAYALFGWMTVSNGDNAGSSSSSSSSANSRSRSRSGGGGGSGSDKKGGPSTHTDGGKWTNPFKAFTSWRAKHRDAAEEFRDGPLV